MPLEFLVSFSPPENLPNIAYAYQSDPYSDSPRLIEEFVRNWSWSEGIFSDIQRYHYRITNPKLNNRYDKQWIEETMYYAELTCQQFLNEPGQRKLNEFIDFDQTLKVYGKFWLRYILKRPVANLLPKVYDENAILTLNPEVNLVDQLLLNQQENLINKQEDLIDEILVLNQEENIPDDVPLNPKERQVVQYRLLDWALLYSEDNNPQGNFIARYISLIFDCYQKPQYLTDQYQLYLDVYAQEVNRRLNDKPENLEKLIELYQNFKTRQKLFVKEILRNPLTNLLAEPSSDESPLNQEEKTRIYALLEEWTKGGYSGYATIDDYVCLVVQADVNPQFADEQKERIKIESHEITEKLKELPGQLDDLKQIYLALNTPEQIFVRQILRTPVSNLLLEVIKLDNESVSLNQEQKIQVYNLLLGWTQSEYADYDFMPGYIELVFYTSQDSKLVRQYKTIIDQYVQGFSSQLSNNLVKLERLRQLYGELNTQEQIFARNLLKIPVVNLLLPDNENVSLTLEVNVSLNQLENVSLNQEQNVPLNEQEKIQFYALLEEWAEREYGNHSTLYEYIKLVCEASESPQFAEEVKEKIDLDSQQVSWELIEAEDLRKLEQLKRRSLILKRQEKVFLRELLKPLIAHLLPDPYTEKVSLTEEEKGRIYNLLGDWLGGQQSGLFNDYLNAVISASSRDTEDEETQLQLDSLSFEVSQKLMDEEPPEKLQRLKQLSESLEKPEKDFLHELLRPVVASLLD